MMWILFEIVINFLQAVMILLFMKSRLHISKPRKLWDILCVASVTVFFSLYQFVDLPIPDTFVFVIPFIYAIMAADDKWYVSVFWVLVLAVLFLSAISLSLHIFMTLPAISYDNLMADTAGRAIFVVITNLILFLIVYSTSKLKKEYSTPSWPVLLLFLMTNVSLFIVEESLFTLQMDLENSYSLIEKPPFFLAYVCLCLCTFFLIFLFHMMSQSAARENRYKTEARTMALSKQHQQELERMYSDLQAQKHDFQQHYQALEEMVRLGTNQDAKAYLASYEKELAAQELFITGCTAVDALLTSKYLTMKKHDILFKYNSYPLEDLPIAEIDFCAIVGNILDNAIEGTLRITNAGLPREVHLTFSRSWNMFYIFCSNPCNMQTIQKGRNGWLSSKEKEGAPGVHAIGIRNVEQIVDLAEGRSSFQIENDTFNVKIVLPYPFK